MTRAPCSRRRVAHRAVRGRLISEARRRRSRERAQRADLGFEGPLGGPDGPGVLVLASPADLEGEAPHSAEELHDCRSQVTPFDRAATSPIDSPTTGLTLQVFGARVIDVRKRPGQSSPRGSDCSAPLGPETDRCPLLCCLRARLAACFSCRLRSRSRLPKDVRCRPRPAISAPRCPLRGAGHGTAQRLAELVR